METTYTISLSMESIADTPEEAIVEFENTIKSGVMNPERYKIQVTTQ